MIQTINMTTSQDPWALGHGIVQGKFQRNCRCCHVDGLNQTDQCKEEVNLIYTGQFDSNHQGDNISKS